MSRRMIVGLVGGICCIFAVAISPAAEVTPCPAARPGSSSEIWFATEIWAKVAQRECLKCHKSGGDAEETRFVLSDPDLRPSSELRALLRENRDALARMARITSDGRPLLLVKATGGLDHGGNVVLEPGSSGHRLLEEFIRRLSAPEGTADEPTSDLPEPSFVDGVVLLGDAQLLGRATLALAGRLPTD